MVCNIKEREETSYEGPPLTIEAAAMCLCGLSEPSTFDHFEATYLQHMPWQKKRMAEELFEAFRNRLRQAEPSKKPIAEDLVQLSKKLCGL